MYRKETFYSSSAEMGVCIGMYIWRENRAESMDANDTYMTQNTESNVHRWYYKTYTAREKKY